MPPLCRKKKVIERYNPDTFRVISQYAEETHMKGDFEETNKPSEWRRIWLENQGLALPDIYNKKTEVLPQAAPDFRAHRPHPGSCGFLRHNVRLLNEPICSVYTDINQGEPTHWWPSRVSKESLQLPPRTNNTIYRSDFLERERPSSTGFGSTRHMANPHKEPALGTVPVNFLRPRDGQQRFFKEKISYEHQYNSRYDANYPIRGKRHGSFVWDPMSKESTKKFIDHYSVISPEEGVRRQELLEADKLASEVAKALEVACMEQTVPEPVTDAQSNQMPNQESPKASNKGSPVNNGPASLADPNIQSQSAKAGSKKVSSRKSSISNGNNQNESSNSSDIKNNNGERLGDNNYSPVKEE